MLFINSVRTSQETHYVSATILLKEKILLDVGTILNTQIHCVGRMQSFYVLKQVVRIERTDVKGFIYQEIKLYLSSGEYWYQ
jgi:hypothetical protein